jgi:uncharacterized protein
VLSKQIIIIGILLPFVEYFSFRAVKNALTSIPVRTQRNLIIAYFLLSLAIVCAIIIFPLYATSGWPNLFIKAIISVLIVFFFGQFIIAMLMLCGDILRLIAKIGRLLFQNKKKGSHTESGLRGITRKEFISKASLICGGLLSAGLLYGMRNKYRYQLRRIQLSAIGDMARFKGLRMVQISDIHCGSLSNIEAVSEGFGMIANLNPDLIFFTGDLVNYRSSEVIPFIPLLKSLHAPLGIYSILGNHDYGDYIHWPNPEARVSDFDQLLSYQRQFGWHVLRNENILLNWRGNDFTLVGVENWSAKARFHRYGDLNKAMEGTEHRQVPLTILLSHDPSHWDAETRSHFPGIYLTLSGHTHGMQMGVDNRYFKWSPIKYLYKRWAGLYQEQNQFLYVNRGFGYIGYEGRLGVLPEITLFEWV